MPFDSKRAAQRSAALIAAVLAAALLASPPASSTAASARGLPPQGLYEGCAPGTEGDACVERLVRIRAAGFRCVLNYSAWYGSPADVLRYANAAAALGLQLIWPLNNPAWRDLGTLGATYSSLVAGRTSLANAEVTSLAVGLVANHPATWGFYIGDELSTAEAARVRHLSAVVRSLAPGKPQLYIARPGVGRLEPFARIADVAGTDTYPVGSRDPPVRQAAQSAQAAASAAGARTAMALQAFSWSQYKPNLGPPQYPSVSNLRRMRDAAIRHAHPALILWYSYQDILRSDDPQRRWRDLANAAFAPFAGPGAN
jgi:hypothetical protein